MRPAPDPSGQFSGASMERRKTAPPRAGMDAHPQWFAP